MRSMSRGNKQVAKAITQPAPHPAYQREEEEVSPDPDDNVDPARRTSQRFTSTKYSSTQSKSTPSNSPKQKNSSKSPRATPEETRKQRLQTKKTLHGESGKEASEKRKRDELQDTDEEGTDINSNNKGNKISKAAKEQSPLHNIISKAHQNIRNRHQTYPPKECDLNHEEYFADSPPAKIRNGKTTKVAERLKTHKTNVSSKQPTTKNGNKQAHRQRGKQVDEESSGDATRNHTDTTVRKTNKLSLQRDTTEYSASDSDTPYKRGKSLYDENAAQYVADYTILECLMRQAIHDFSPLKKYKKTVMYWSTKNISAAAQMLIERHLEDIPEIIDRYGGPTSVITFFGKKLRNLANNERAIQTGQLKTTFLSKKNPEYRLAENILDKELDLDSSNPTRLHCNVDHIATVEELRDLLLSPKMYQDHVLFDIFCLGLESGNFRQNRKRPHTPLDLLITKAHEAHFRCELYLALSKKSFRHHNTTTDIKERVRIFNVAINAVREGRQKYLMKAIETRMKSRTPKQVDECERLGDQEGSSDDNVDIDEDDL
jgi:hypothetical protein